MNYEEKNLSTPTFILTVYYNYNYNRKFNFMKL